MKKSFLNLCLKVSIKKYIISVKQFQIYYFSAALLSQCILLQKLFNVIDFLEELSLWLSIEALSTFRQIKGSSQLFWVDAEELSVTICIWALQLQVLKKMHLQ